MMESLECQDKMRGETSSVIKSDVFYCIVVGSRSFNDYDFLCQKLDHILKNQKKICIISGGAAGADSLAKKYALEKNYIFKEFPANWKLYGNMAGLIRNRKMCEYALSQGKCGMIAFWDGQSKGTMHDINLAKEYDIDNRVIIVKC